MGEKNINVAIICQLTYYVFNKLFPIRGEEIFKSMFFNYVFDAVFDAVLTV